ncbi:MAG: AMP-binding protein [Sporichthyaceae bacterium]|nr:AMP-binding protein [Sporichthyaceae bacterium]
MIAAIAECARRQPDAIAIEDGRVKLHYDELLASIRATASRIASDSEPGTIIAVDAARNADTVIALLGVLAADRIYFPIDPASPANRWKELVDLARPALSWPAAVRHADPRVVTPADAAYLLFTSGSTGMPKGVVGTGGGLANMAESLCAVYAYGPGDRLLAFATFSWDTSLEEILPALVGGGTVVFRPEPLGTMGDFVDFVAERELTGLNVPTAFWTELVAGPDLPPSVRLVITGGEPVPADAVAHWRDRYDERIRLVNTFGLTEATAVTTIADLTSIAPAPGELFAPIGGRSVDLPSISSMPSAARSPTEQSVRLLSAVPVWLRDTWTNPRPVAGSRWITPPAAVACGPVTWPFDCRTGCCTSADASTIS